MTLAALRTTHPGYAKAYHMVRISRLTLKEAARRLGVSAPTVRERAALACRLMEGGKMGGNGMTAEQHDRELSRMGRCRCGLLWPCFNCGGGADPLSRPGVGDTYPEGGGW